MELKEINAFIKKVELSGKKTMMPAGKGLKVGVDLGTAYIVIVVLDENNKPVAYEKRAAGVLRDGVVVDYIGAQRIVGELKASLEERIKCRLETCCIAMPPGTTGSIKTHLYVAEGAGFEVVRVLDEPTAANALFEISDGVIVDIGGGTTGLSVVKEGQVTYTADEATGGIHLTLVIAGSMGISFEEAEKLKMNSANHKRIFPAIEPVIKKMVTIVGRHIDKTETDVLYLCGGTCCMTGMEKVFEDHLDIPVIKPEKPFLITPIGIAMSCFEKEVS